MPFCIIPIRYSPPVPRRFCLFNARSMRTYARRKNAKPIRNAAPELKERSKAYTFPLTNKNYNTDEGRRLLNKSKFPISSQFNPGLYKFNLQSHCGETRSLHVSEALNSSAPKLKRPSRGPSLRSLTYLRTHGHKRHIFRSIRTKKMTSQRFGEEEEVSYYDNLDAMRAPHKPRMRLSI